MASMGRGRSLVARVRAAAAVTAEINVRASPLLQALRQGASVEPVLAQRLAQPETNRRARYEQWLSDRLVEILRRPASDRME